MSGVYRSVLHPDPKAASEEMDEVRRKEVHTGREGERRGQLGANQEILRNDQDRPPAERQVQKLEVFQIDF